MNHLEFYLFITLLLTISLLFEREKRWLWRQILDLKMTLNQTYPLNKQETLLTPHFENLHTAKTIFVLKLDHIGDMILTIPALQALRKNLPNAHITLACGPWGKELLEQEKLIDTFIITSIPNKSLPTKEKKIETNRLKKRLQENSYDIAFDLRHYGDTQHWFKWVNAPVKIGTKSAHTPSNIKLTFSTIPPHEKHMTEKITHIVECMGLSPKSYAPSLTLSEQEKTQAHLFFNQKNWDPTKCIGLHPYANATTRDWGINNFIETANHLETLGYTCLFFIGNRADEVTPKLKKNSTSKIHTISNTTLRESAALIQCCSLFISNNSGPMHLAASVQCPTLAIFSGTEISSEWGPYGPNHHTIAVDLPCIRCHKGHCWHKTCLISIAPITITNQALKMLSNLT
ncbi:MAG: glycosyltransferase family 9 protein [Candidatus Margulisbacteria bacterium]|nr:glycosyltransferase family 9 protein [Candidatus Margulisiibacteriota bacterium]